MCECLSKPLDDIHEVRGRLAHATIYRMKYSVILEVLQRCGSLIAGYGTVGGVLWHTRGTVDGCSVGIT